MASSRSSNLEIDPPMQRNSSMNSLGSPRDSARQESPAGTPRSGVSPRLSASKFASNESVSSQGRPSNKSKDQLRTSTTSTRSSRSGQSAALQALENRPGKMNASHIARPEASKWALAAKQAMAGEIEVESLLQGRGYTSVADKEESLEAIMSAEAHLSFDCLGRHQLEPGYITRNSMNPNGPRGKHLELQKLLQNIKADDLMDVVDESDEEYAKKHDFKSWQAQPGDLSFLPPSLTEKCNCRFGVALPLSKHAKVGIGSAIGSLLAAEGKGGGALAKAADLSLERAFAGRCGDFCLAGVANAHGNPKWAGSVAWCIAKEMPKAVFASAAFKRKNPAKALQEAFSKVHRSVASQFDCSCTGAAVSVVLISKEHIWVAHVGDCRVVLGVPDSTGMSRDFHYVPNAVTQDHKLSVKKEFDRIKEAGGEVRKLMHDGMCRIFVEDTIWPCLALTRCVGDRLAHTVGVTHKPTISMLNRKDLARGTFLVLGSAGLWTCTSEKAAVNWLSRQFPDPQAAMMSLSAEAMGRWEAQGSKLRGQLHPKTLECFSSFLIRLEADEEDVPVQTPRKFVVGPINQMGGASQKPWKEVKSANRVLELRRMQQHSSAVGEVQPQ